MFLKNHTILKVFNYSSLFYILSMVLLSLQNVYISLHILHIFWKIKFFLNKYCGYSSKLWNFLFVSEISFILSNNFYISIFLKYSYKFHYFTKISFSLNIWQNFLHSLKIFFRKKDNNIILSTLLLFTHINKNLLFFNSYCVNNKCFKFFWNYFYFMNQFFLSYFSCISKIDS